MNPIHFPEDILLCHFISHHQLCVIQSNEISSKQNEKKWNVKQKVSY